MIEPLREEGIVECKWEDYFNLCKDEISRNPKNVFAHLDMAEAARRYGEYDVAIKACEDAIRLNPSISMPYELAARVYMESEFDAKSRAESDDCHDGAEPMPAFEKCSKSSMMAEKALKRAPGNIESQMCYMAGMSRRGWHLYATGWAVRHSRELDIIYEITWENELGLDSMPNTDMGVPLDECFSIVSRYMESTGGLYGRTEETHGEILGPMSFRKLRHMYAELFTDKTLAQHADAKYLKDMSIIFSGMREGVRLHAQGYHYAARRIFETEAQRCADDDGEFIFSLDRCYALINLGRYDEALDDCVQALDDDMLENDWNPLGALPYQNIRTEYGRACYVKGVALAKLGRMSEARYSFASSIENADPRNKVVY